jgi:hypothetical protein
MTDDLTTWVPLVPEADALAPAGASPWLCLHFADVRGRVECVGLELWTGPRGAAHGDAERCEPARGLRARDVRAIKLETHIRAAIDRNPHLKARFEQATGGTLGARGKYDRTHFEHVAAIYAEAVLSHEPPTQAVQVALGISYPAAAGQITRARQLKLLPKATGRRIDNHVMDDEPDPFAYHRVLARTQPDTAARRLHAEAEGLEESAEIADENAARYRQFPTDTTPPRGYDSLDAYVNEMLDTAARYQELAREARALAQDIANRESDLSQSGESH